jgi:hypothetical protein
MGNLLLRCEENHQVIEAATKIYIEKKEGTDITENTEIEMAGCGD